MAAAIRYLSVAGVELVAELLPLVVADIDDTNFLFGLSG